MHVYPPRVKFVVRNKQKEFVLKLKIVFNGPNDPQNISLQIAFPLGKSRLHVHVYHSTVLFLTAEFSQSLSREMSTQTFCQAINSELFNDCWLIASYCVTCS